MQSRLAARIALVATCVVATPSCLAGRDAKAAQARASDAERGTVSFDQSGMAERGHAQHAGLRLKEVGMPDAPAPVQLSPYNLVLPSSPLDASDAMKDFVDAARHAIAQTYRQDSDDASVLLALQDELAHKPALLTLRPLWASMLAAATARAATLASLAPTLRSLRAALHNAYFDEAPRAYRDVDAAQCRAAARGVATQAGALSTVVTIEPVGTYPLDKLLNICAQAQALQLRERRMPGTKASPQVQRLVRKLYGEAHLGGQVQRVSLIKTWHREGAQGQSFLKAVVAIRRDPHASRDEPSCSIAELSLMMPRDSHGKTPLIAEVGERRPILCDAIN